MSTQKGNSTRSRPQKHKNTTAFKNTLHDTSHKTKFINSIQVCEVCVRCKEIIEWKIKYKKYKPLTQPKKCVKCDQKAVKKAYHVICSECCKKLEICAKCLSSKEIVPAKPDVQEQAKLDAEMKSLLQSLPERKRRTFLRYLNGKSNKKNDGISEEKTKDELVAKLNSLKVDENEDDFDSDFDDFSEDGDN